MKQEFVTLQREVVEQALEALLNEGNFRKLRKPLIEESIKQIKAALEQPQECYDQREPLTDRQIDAIAESMPGGLDGFLKGWGWRQFARAVLEAAQQPPTVKECLTDELKPRFSAHDDAERLKSVARGMSYNDHEEAVWKHTMMEIAVRLGSGGYAAPQPPALEQQVEKESTCKESLQVEQDPVAWIWTEWSNRKLTFDGPPAVPSVRDELTKPVWTPLYTRPQREPLTDEELDAVMFSVGLSCTAKDVARAIEAAHNIK